jgi:hypothetical protein
LNPLEQTLLHEAVGNAEPLALTCSHTRIDTGRWWRTSPLWLAVMQGEIIVFAVGRRRYLERIPVAGCDASFYNHATGELVFSPAESLRFRQLRMKPSEALRILPLLSSTSKTSTQHP